jgi:hypothetical protein
MLSRRDEDWLSVNKGGHKSSYVTVTEDLQAWVHSNE